MSYKIPAKPDSDSIWKQWEAATERRKAEEQIRQAAAVLENTADAVVITGRAANIVAVNRAFAEITGYTQARWPVKTRAFSSRGGMTAIAPPQPREPVVQCFPAMEPRDRPWLAI